MTIKQLFTPMLLAATLFVSQPSRAEEPRQYVVNVGDFNELSIGGCINVDYRCNPDSAGIVSFFATSNVASAITFANEKNKLTVKTFTDGVTYSNVPTVTVYSRFLNKAENIGDSTLTLVNVAPASQLKLRLAGKGHISAPTFDINSVEATIDNGSGSIEIAGKAAQAKFNINIGSGTINAANLAADDVKCSIIGKGTIYCWPIKDLTVVGTSGSVYFKGNPDIKKRSLGAKIIQID